MVSGTLCPISLINVEFHVNIVITRHWLRREQWLLPSLLGWSWSHLGGLWSQVEGSLIRLGEPWSKQGGAWSQPYARARECPLSSVPSLLYYLKVFFRSLSESFARFLLDVGKVPRVFWIHGWADVLGPVRRYQRSFTAGSHIYFWFFFLRIWTRSINVLASLWYAAKSLFSGIAIILRIGIQVVPDFPPT